MKLVRGSFCCLWPRFPGVDFAEVFFEDTWYRSLGCFRVTQRDRESYSNMTLCRIGQITSCKPAPVRHNKYFGDAPPRFKKPAIWDFKTMSPNAEGQAAMRETCARFTAWLAARKEKVLVVCRRPSCLCFVHAASCGLSSQDA